MSALRVYAPEVLDLAAERRHQDHVRTAQQLGIATVVTGSFHVVGDSLRVDAIIVNTATGLQEGSDSVEGDLKDVLKLQKTLVLNMLQRLPVDVSPAEGQSIREKTNSNVNAYRLLMEAEGMIGQPHPDTGESCAAACAGAAFAARAAADAQLDGALERRAALLARRVASVDGGLRRRGGRRGARPARRVPQRPRRQGPRPPGGGVRRLPAAPARGDERLPAERARPCSRDHRRGD